VISDAAEQVGSLIATVLPFFLTSVALTMAYVSIPNCKVRIGHALFGGIVAALLFELAKRGFALYITTVPTYKLVFGTFATIPIFLVWIYLSWLVVLFGAEIVHGFTDYHPDRNEISRQNRFSIALQIISLCYGCQKKGIPVSKEVLAKEFVHSSEDEIGGVISSLLEIQVLGELSNGAYVLQWDLKELTLSHLYHLLKWPLPDGNDPSLPPAVSNTLNEADKALGKSLAVSLYGLFEISK
jgi:membrane protein